MTPSLQFDSLLEQLTDLKRNTYLCLPLNIKDTAQEQANGRDGHTGQVRKETGLVYACWVHHPSRTQMCPLSQQLSEPHHLGSWAPLQTYRVRIQELGLGSGFSKISPVDFFFFRLFFYNNCLQKNRQRIPMYLAPSFPRYSSINILRQYNTFVTTNTGLY